MSWSDETPWGLSALATAWLIETTAMPGPLATAWRCFKVTDPRGRPLEEELLAGAYVGRWQPDANCPRCHGPTKASQTTPAGLAVKDLMWGYKEWKLEVSREQLRCHIPDDRSQNERIARLYDYRPSKRSNPEFEAVRAAMKVVRPWIDGSHCRPGARRSA